MGDLTCQTPTASSLYAGVVRATFVRNPPPGSAATPDNETDRTP